MPDTYLAGNGNGNKMNLRVEIIENLLNSSGDGNSAKINSLRQAIRRNKSDMADTATKSLDVLRQIFQSEISHELNDVIDRHLRTTFAPAIENLKRNGHDVSITDINLLRIAILEGAMPEFADRANRLAGTDADGRPICIPSHDVLKSIPSYHTGKHRSLQRENNMTKAYESEDNESDSSMISYNSALSSVPLSAYGAGRCCGGRTKKRGRPRKTDMDSGRCGTPIIQGTHPVTMAEALKWNPERICVDETRFVLVSKANKILRGGHRNRIFAKYSRLFRYAADEEDKMWLFDRSVSTRMSGKVLLMVLDDCLEIAQLEGAPVQSRVDLKRYSFAITERMCEKMRRYMALPFEKLKTRIVVTNAPPSAAATTAAALLLQQQAQQQQAAQHFDGGIPPAVPQHHSQPPPMSSFNYM